MSIAVTEVGGKSKYASCFCNCLFSFLSFFSPDCEHIQNLKMGVHATGGTQHAPFAVVDPTTFMKEVCFPGRTQESNVQGNFCTAGSFIHFSQNREMGLLLLDDETRAYSQGGEQHTFPSVRQCGILLGKRRFPGEEPGALAVPSVS